MPGNSAMAGAAPGLLYKAARLQSEQLSAAVHAVQEYIMNKLQKQLEKLAAEKGTLQRERTDLQRQCSEMSAAVEKLNRDKVSCLLQ